MEESRNCMCLSFSLCLSVSHLNVCRGIAGLRLGAVWGPGFGAHTTESFGYGA